MTDKNRDSSSGTVTRRAALKRGAIAGGTLLWAAPIVQTIGMSPALAQQTSPARRLHAVSFIALNVECSGQPFFIKYEVDEGAFEDDPGRAPFCDCHFTPTGTKADGAALGFTVSGPNTQGCLTVTVPPTCDVIDSAVMGGTVCCQGAVGGGNLLFCPPDCTPCPSASITSDPPGNGNGPPNGTGRGNGNGPR